MAALARVTWIRVGRCFPDRCRSIVFSDSGVEQHGQGHLGKDLHFRFFEDSIKEQKEKTLGWAGMG